MCFHFMLHVEANLGRRGEKRGEEVVETPSTAQMLEPSLVCCFFSPAGELSQVGQTAVHVPQPLWVITPTGTRVFHSNEYLFQTNFWRNCGHHNSCAQKLSRYFLYRKS